ncbi:MAG: MFS transporter, partial [Actinomycetota bacterium]|nr:MFS transporter [Actinomycetota bacterium]
VLDASATEMGLLAAAGWLPHLVFALGAGLWVDRRRRKRSVMVATDLGRAAMLLSVPLAYWLDALTIGHLIAAAFAVGALTVVFDIAWGVLFMRVVPREDVVEANGKLMTSRSLSFVVGPPGAGGLVQAFGAPVAILVDAVSFVVSALFVGRVRVDELPAPDLDGERVRARLASGFRFLFKHEILRPTLLCLATINLFNLGFGAIVVLYMARTLGLSAATIGILLGAAAVGGVIGALTAPAIGRRIGMGPALTLGAVLFTAPLLLFPLAGGPRPLLLGLLFVGEFLSGIGVMLLDIQGNSLAFLLTPEDMRARQLATFKFVNYGVRPFGALAGGLLAEAIGLREALLVTAVGGMLGVLWLLPSPTPRLRELPAG